MRTRGFWGVLVIVVVLVVMMAVTISAQTAGGGGGSFTDARDGKTYRTVKIGNQTWMAENLNHQTEGSWCYGDDKSNCATYGRLYTWEAAMNGASSSHANPSGVQGVCPVGWHLPSDAEWAELINFVSTSTTSTNSAGTRLKSTSGWNTGSGYIPGTDDFGFSALPGGVRSSGGNFNNAGYYGNWWSATESGADRAWGRDMGYHLDFVDRDDWLKTYALSVRCLRD